MLYYKYLYSFLKYILFQAALCALRIIRKVPDLMENYVVKANKLLNEEKNHAILLTGTTLLTEMCLLDKNVLNDTRKVNKYIYIIIYINSI